jgi:hypothetical protein
MRPPTLPLNLKTNFGCCSLAPLPQECDFTLMTPQNNAILRFTRPPLIIRECCIEGLLPEAQPYFQVIE